MTHNTSENENMSPGEDSSQEEEEQVSETESDTEALNLDFLSGGAPQDDDKLLRTLADMENMRRRHDRERQELIKYAPSLLTKDLLDTFDNFSRAIASCDDEMRENEKVNNLYEGLVMVEKEIKRKLRAHGIKELVPQVGEVFNKQYHQALAEDYSEEAEAGTIAVAYSSAYVIHERLLRAASVVISKGAKQDDNNNKHTPIDESV